ncbi:hypothetical protein V2J09_023078 [Rumex salicifolius]
MEVEYKAESSNKAADALAPLSLKHHLHEDFLIAAVAEEFWYRDEVLQQLKYKLDRAQKKMSNSSNKYKESWNSRKESWYFGPFMIIRRVGVVAYELRLLDNVKIPSIFHTSLLKKVKGDHRALVELPAELICEEEEHQLKKGACYRVLVQWEEETQDEANQTLWTRFVLMGVVLLESMDTLCMDLNQLITSPTQQNWVAKLIGITWKLNTRVEALRKP